MRADDGAWSEPSVAAKVDRTPPPAPGLHPPPPPIGWFAAVTPVRLDAVDPPLPDGSTGSGVAPTLNHNLDTGVHTVSGQVHDVAGNWSPPGGGVVRVDDRAPSLALVCPSTIVRGARALGRWTAADAGVGLATPPTGTVALGRSGVAQVRSADLLGNAVIEECRYAVRHPLRVYTRAARLRPDGTLRLRVGCRLTVCRAVLRAGGGRSRARRILRRRPATVVVRGVRVRGRVAVRQGTRAARDRRASVSRGGRAATRRARGRARPG